MTKHLKGLTSSKISTERFSVVTKRLATAKRYCNSEKYYSNGLNLSKIKT